MIFNGLDEWKEGEPLGELDAEGQYIDLAGFATFEGFEYRLPETLILRFLYDDREARKLGWHGINRIELRFDGVQITGIGYHLPSRVVLEPDRLDHFVYFREKSYGHVEFVLFDGLRINFRCGAVTFGRTVQ